MSAAVVTFVAFLAGLACGALFREAWELIKERDTPMRILGRIKRNQTSILAWALLAVLVFNAIVGASVIVNDNQRESLVRCLTTYNEQSGTARDERTEASGIANAAQLVYVREDLRYQRGLLRTIESEVTSEALTAVIRDRIAANEGYLRTLQQQQRVRDRTEYPAPDLCEDEQ